MKGYLTDEGAEKLWDVLDMITERPELWDQDNWYVRPSLDTVPSAEQNWSCGTTACVAGWLAIREGWVPEGLIGYWLTKTNEETGRTTSRTADSVATEVLVGENDTAEAVYRTHKLFRGGNTLTYLWEQANRISDGYIVKGGERANSETSTGQL